MFMEASLPRHLSLSVLVSVLGAVGTASAQGLPSPPPNPALEERRALEREQELQQRLQQQQKERQQQAESAAAQSQQAMVSNPFATLPAHESPCFTISEIRISGVNGSAVPSELLSGLEQALAHTRNAQTQEWVADSPQGRCLGAQGINVLLERAQNHLIARGYITSRVLAPQQDLKAGRLTLVVVPGRIGAIRTAPDVSPEQAARAGLYTGIPTAPGRVLNLRDIEQGLENLKRVPSADADIQIAPSAAPASGKDALPFGQSDLVVQYKQGRPVRFNFSVDDSGTDNTGKYQGSATLSLDNTLAMHDLFYATVNSDLGGGRPATEGQRGTRGHVLHYSVPFGYWTVGGTWSGNRYHQSVAGASQNYLYSGDSRNMEVFLSRLLYRDAHRKTTATLKAFSRSSHNFIDDVEIEVQRRRVGGWAAQLNHREYFGKASLDLTLGYKRGTGAFRSEAAPEETFGEGTSRFSLWTMDAALNAPFKLGEQYLRYYGSWRWQHNRTPLTPQDRFSIGGRYTVRGFDGESTLMAERGWLLRNELGLMLGSSGQELYAGVDYGRVGGPSSQWLLGKSLAGAVLGLRGGGFTWAPGLSYDVFVGKPVHKPQGFKTANTTAGFSVNWSF